MLSSSAPHFGRRTLKDMTLEELWELFPVILVPHQDTWTFFFEEEKAFLQSLFPDAVISHVGSTAVPEIMSKPTIDVLMEFSSLEKMSRAASEMENHGYLRMSENPARISLNKGYTENGYSERVFHLHLRQKGDNAEIKFRDYLRRHPDKAKEYETLKLELAAKYRNNRDAYTEAKTEFIKNVIEL